MILVDVYVPSVDNKYDFQLDEDTSIATIIEEVSEIISQKEQCVMLGKVDQMLLCSAKDERILRRRETLKGENIVTGDSLILV